MKSVFRIVYLKAKIFKQTSFVRSAPLGGTKGSEAFQFVSATEPGMLRIPNSSDFKKKVPNEFRGAA